MTLTGMRTRLSDDCLSDRRLDALLAGELDDSQRSDAAQHLAACTRCTARRAELMEHAQGFLEAHPAAPLPLPVTLASRRREKRQRLAWWSTGLAAAAALLLLMRMPDRGDIRQKGNGGSVGFFVRHGDQVRRGVAGEHVSPGDALRFVVSQEEPSYVAVLSRDAAGQVSIYYPDAAQAVLVQAGVEQALDASVILDAVTGEERLYALRCTKPVELAPLRAALTRDGALHAWPEGCRVEQLTLFKKGP